MNHRSHRSLTRAEYAYQVYELLAAHQVAEDLYYDGSWTITAARLETVCTNNGTQITFPDPYTDEPAVMVMLITQAPTAVASVMEALLTRFASHLAFVAAEAAQAHLEEVD
jgi:hypothetical protein